MKGGEMLQRINLPISRKLVDITICLALGLLILMVLDGMTLFSMTWVTRETERGYMFARPNFENKTTEAYWHENDASSESFNIRPYRTRWGDNDHSWYESLTYEYACECVTTYSYSSTDGTDFTLIRSSPNDPNITVLQWKEQERTETVLPAEATADLFQEAAKLHASLRAKYKDLVR